MIQTMPGFTVWFTGLPCSGKSTQAQLLATELALRGWGVEILDADAACDAGNAATQSHRLDSNDEIRRTAHVARLLNKHGAAVIVDSVSADSKVRTEIRDAAGKFAEVYVKATLVTCFQRDTEGMYRKAMAGEIRGFIGIDKPYEPPLHPELILETENDPPEVCAERMIATLELMGYIECQSDVARSRRAPASVPSITQSSARRT
jgi:adenylylsulfate kinase-like enzyme